MTTSAPDSVDADLAPEPHMLALVPFLVDERTARSILQRMAGSAAPANLTAGSRRAALRLDCRVIAVEQSRLLLRLDREVEAQEDAAVVGLLDRHRIQFPVRRLRRPEQAVAVKFGAQAGDGVILQCELPSWLARINRRKTFRAGATPRLPISVRIAGVGPAKEPLSCRLLDLSVGGMAFELPAADERELKPGDVLAHCWLEAEDLRTQEFELVVRGVEVGTGRALGRRIGASLSCDDAGVTSELQMVLYRLEAARRGR